MSQISIPNIFSNGSTADANAVNSNFSTIYAAFNSNIDNTNIGIAGIFASQILPTNIGQATFGGSQAYAFATAVTFGSTAVFSAAANFLASAVLTSPYGGSASFAFNSGASSGVTTLSAASAGTVSGINGFVLSIADQATAQLVNVDNIGNVGILGAVVAKNVQSYGGGTTPAYCPPVKTPTGGVTGPGEIIARNSVAIAIGNTNTFAQVNVTLAADAIRTAYNSYQVIACVNVAGSTYPTGWLINTVTAVGLRVSGSTFTIYVGETRNNNATSTGTIVVDYIIIGN